MAYAVIDSDGTLSCAVGSEDDDTAADTASDIELEDNTASTIMDVKDDHDFGDCVIWAIITVGSETGCNPAVFPPYSSGISGIELQDYAANVDEDTVSCSLGGTISIDDAGTEIEFS